MLLSASDIQHTGQVMFHVFPPMFSFKPLPIENGSVFGRQHIKTYPLEVSGEHFQVIAHNSKLIDITHNGRHSGHVEYLQSGLVTQLSTGDEFSMSPGDMYYPVNSLPVYIEYEQPGDDDDKTLFIEEEGGAVVAPVVVAKPKEEFLPPRYVFGTLMRGFIGSVRRYDEAKLIETIEKEQLPDTVNEADGQAEDCQDVVGEDTKFVRSTVFWDKKPSVYLNMVRPDIVDWLPMRKQDKNEMKKLRAENELVHRLPDDIFYNTPSGTVEFTPKMLAEQAAFAKLCKLDPAEQARIHKERMAKRAAEEEAVDSTEEDAIPVRRAVNKSRVLSDTEEAQPLAASIRRKRAILAEDSD